MVQYHVLFVEGVYVRVRGEHESLLALQVVGQVPVKRLVVVVHGEAEVLDEVSF